MGPDEKLPRWAQKFLSVVCPSWMVEEVEGDLVQKYQFDIQQYGARRARRKLISNILRFFRPGVVFRNKFFHNSNRPSMIRNYILTAMRVSRRQRLYTMINVLGLSVGLAASLLIGIYIADEFSYDRNFADADRIYRVGINETFKGDEILYSSSGAPLAEGMRQEIPEVEDATRVMIISSPLRVGDRSFFEKRMLIADSNFFRFFGLTLIEGNIDKCLKGPNKVVLSESAAKNYFGYDGHSGQSPIGKQIIVNRANRVAEVTGIFADQASNTHMKYNMIESMESFPFNKNDCWGCYNAKTYFKIIKGQDVASVENKLQEFAEQRIIPGIEKDLNITHDQFQKSGDLVKFFLQPLLSIHLHSNIDGEFEPNGDIRYVYILGIAAIFLVIIACINFMNLSTARAVSRGKEVGVRKTMGATRSGLIPQFMLESSLYVILSGALAIAVAGILLKPFGNISGKELSLGIVMNGSVIITFVIGLIFVGFLAGIYPAFYLTSFSPTSALKGKTNGSSKSMLRNGLVVLQFTISLVLIIGTLVIYKQLNFLQNQNLGFDKENVVRVKETFSLGDNFKAFKNDLLTHSEFVDATYASNLPPEVQSTTFFKVEGSNQLVSAFYTFTDQDFLATMGGAMKEGRFFSRDFRSDSSAIIMNEAAARLLDFKMSDQKKAGMSDSRMYTVVGIMKDFNFASLRSDIQPLMVLLGGNGGDEMAIRLSQGNPSAKIELLNDIWAKYSNGQALEYSFVDEDFDNLFRSEQRLGLVFSIFTGLAIFIACLGLFGLITFIATQRTKEIGIRKVLGASSTQVTILLLRDLMRLVLISFVISIPLAWYGMNEWLQSFAYRTDVDVLSIVIAGMAALLIAVLTVGYRSMKAASANPVDSLKCE